MSEFENEVEVEVDDLNLPPPWPNVGFMLSDFGRALVHQRWHDGILASLVADGKITYGDVFRLTSHACWGVHKLIEQWRHEIRLNFTGEFDVIRDVDPFDFTTFMEEFHNWVTDPGRTLPTHGTVGTLLGDAYPDYLEQSENWLDSVLGFGDDELPGEGVIVISMLGAIGVPCTWWGAPQWPDIVDVFVDALDDPDHHHWSDFEISFKDLAPQPAGVKNRRRLRKHLLDNPWTIDTPSADWMVQAGLEFLFSLPQPTEEELKLLKQELANLEEDEQPELLPSSHHNGRKSALQRTFDKLGTKGSS